MVSPEDVQTSLTGARGGAVVSDSMVLFAIEVMEAGSARWESRSPRRHTWRPPD